MSSRALCTTMRAAIIATAVCGLILCCYIIPELGSGIAAVNPDYAQCYWPWLLFTWAVFAPCFAILVYVWKVAGAVGRERVFAAQTAAWIRNGAVLLFAAVGLFIAGNIAFVFAGMSHFVVLLVSMLISIFAIALAVLAAVLSRYIVKAALLQEESEGTI